MENTQILLANRPHGLPTDDVWKLEKGHIPTPKEGEILIKNRYISLDPAMRGWITDRKSYIPPVQLGEVMRAAAVGRVIASRNPNFREDDLVYGWTGVQQYCVTNGTGFFKVQEGAIPLPTYLGTLGITGYTAYFGLLDIGQPKPGETILVSGAAGAVGSIVGQIAKIKGCRAVGIAGGPEKCAYLTEELGFDGAIDYKNESVRDGIKRTCPDGVDVYFDNVGGKILDTVLTKINRNARIVICGAISQYNATSYPEGPKNYMSLLVNRARMEGFLVFDFADRYGEAAKELSQWLIEGKIKSKEFIVEGIDNFPAAFLRLFSGEKLGKLVLKV